MTVEIVKEIVNGIALVAIVISVLVFVYKMADKD